MARRMSAKEELTRMAQQLRYKAHALEILADSVGFIQGEAEVALWNLITEVRR